MDCSPLGSSVHGITPGKNTTVGSHFLLQRIFPIQGSNQCLLCLLHWLYYWDTWEAQNTYAAAAAAVTSVVSDSVRPHRRQLTRLPCPWDSPGKNTGVGCHFLLQCMKVKSEKQVAQSWLTLSNPMDCSLPVSSIHGIFQARVLEWGNTYNLTHFKGETTKASQGKLSSPIS